MDKGHNVFLGRPFVASTKTLVDVHNVSLIMIVLGEIIKFKAHLNKDLMMRRTLSVSRYMNHIFKQCLVKILS